MRRDNDDRKGYALRRVIRKGIPGAHLFLRLMRDAIKLCHGCGTSWSVLAPVRTWYARGLVEAAAPTGVAAFFYHRYSIVCKWLEVAMASCRRPRLRLSALFISPGPPLLTLE